MKQTPINAKDAPQAAGGYSQAFGVEGATKLVFISGQIPETKDGIVPDGFQAQADLVWKNIAAQLEASGLAMGNLIKVTTFLSSRDFAIPNREARQRALGNHSPALTVIIVGIFDEKWLLEIEAVAAS
jgi:2-iminobutanoate/2-iminopropanoate deaminase